MKRKVFSEEPISSDESPIFPLNVMYLSVIPKPNFVYSLREIDSLKEDDLVPFFNQTRQELKNLDKKKRLKKKKEVYIIPNPNAGLSDMVTFHCLLSENSYSQVNNFGIRNLFISGNEINDKLFPPRLIKIKSYESRRPKYLYDSDLKRAFEFGGELYEPVEIKVRGNMPIFEDVLQLMSDSFLFRKVILGRTSFLQRDLINLEKMILETERKYIENEEAIKKEKKEEKYFQLALDYNYA